MNWRVQYDLKDEPGWELLNEFEMIRFLNDLSWQL